jgi:heterodisulfide reductase subunit A
VKICPELELDGAEETRNIKTGSIIVATGFDPYEPGEGEFGYGTADAVVTLQQFRRLTESSGERLVHNGRDVKNIAWIYCVGSRQTGALEGKNKYCARYCCTGAIHAAVSAKKKYGDIRNYHFTRGVRTYGKLESIYEESSRLGDVYLQSYDDAPPQVSERNGETIVRIRDVLTGDMELEVAADLVVLVTGMVPRANGNVGAIVKAPTGRDGFFNEVHPKLKPVETVIDGVFLAGTSQGPKNIGETLMSAHSAAVKTNNLIGRGEIELEPTVARIDRTICEWCGKCAAVCPFDAIEAAEHEGKKVAVVNDSACKGCGMCLPVCPVNAIQLLGFTDGEITAMIDALADKPGVR